MTANAQLIESRHSKTCSICMLLDSEAKDMKWHLFKQDIYPVKEYYVCNDCVEGLMDIRKKCHEKFDNPKHKKFDGFMPWFTKQIPGLSEVFKRQVETITP